ncbi:MAG TPA: DUF3343 domain-containing protein [Coriobacteriia bacterium]|jgi:ribosomal protein L7Ae-like RNA K-turn-binding protein
MSRERSEFVVLGFPSTHDALAAESLLKDLGVPVVPVPAPQEIGALCGIALRLVPGDVLRARELLERASIPIAAEVTVDDV